MQALGATTAQITRMVVLEGMAIGLLSWIVAVAVSLPLTNVLAQTGGSIFVNAPLVPAYSFHGAGVWLVVVLTLSAVASAIPAMRTSRRAVRETLNYL
jgi:putative ABC transport system permease protein